MFRYLMHGFRQGPGHAMYNSLTEEISFRPDKTWVFRAVCSDATVNLVNVLGAHPGDGTPNKLETMTCVLWQADPLV